METQNFNPNQKGAPQFNQNAQPNSFNPNMDNKNEKKGIQGETIAAAAVGAAAGAGGAFAASTLMNDDDSLNLDQQIAEAKENLEEAQQELQDSANAEEAITHVEHIHVHAPVPPPPIRPARPVPPVVNEQVANGPAVDRPVEFGGDTSGDLNNELASNDNRFVSGSSNGDIDINNGGNEEFNNGMTPGTEFAENLVDGGETPSEVALTPVEIVDMPTDTGQIVQVIAMEDPSGNRLYLADVDGNGFYNHVVDASGNVIDLDQEYTFPVNLTLSDAEHIIESGGGYINDDLAQTDPLGENPEADIIDTTGANDDLAENSLRDNTGEYVSDEELYNQLFGDDLVDDGVAVYDVPDDYVAQAGDTADIDSDYMEPQVGYETAQAGDTADVATDYMEPQTGYETAQAGDTADVTPEYMEPQTGYETAQAGDTADVTPEYMEPQPGYETAQAGDTADVTPEYMEPQPGYETAQAGDTAGVVTDTLEPQQTYEVAQTGDTADYSADTYDTAQASYDVADTGDTADYSYTPEPEPDYSASVDVPVDDFSVDMIDDA